MPTVTEQSHVLLTGASGFLAVRKSPLSPSSTPTSRHHSILTITSVSLSYTLRYRSTTHRERIQGQGNCPVERERRVPHETGCQKFGQVGICYRRRRRERRCIRRGCKGSRRSFAHRYAFFFFLLLLKIESSNGKSSHES